MKTLARWVIVMGVGIACFAEEAAELPRAVKLTNGATLHEAAVVKWIPDGVVLKHRGGADPVLFKHMADDDRASFIAELEREHACAGIVYITTAGGDTHTFPGVVVSIYDEAGKLVSRVTTNAEGRFAFSWKGPQPFELRATATRQLTRRREFYNWSLKRSAFDDLSRIELGPLNAKAFKMLPGSDRLIPIN